MKLFIFVFLFSFVVQAKELPSIPVNCFTQKSYCTRTSIVKISGKKVIKIKVAAQLRPSRFRNIDDIHNLYFSFSKWGDYASGSNNINIKSSEERFGYRNGKEFPRHYISYDIKAPWPLSSLEIVDLMEYRYVTENYPKSDLSAEFNIVKDFDGRKGVKYNSGQLHVKFSVSSQKYIIIYVGEVIPSINIMLGQAAPYVERALVDVLKGMLDLE